MSKAYGVEILAVGHDLHRSAGGDSRTFLVNGSLTDATSRLISLRIDFAATPVVAVLKSI